MALPHSSISDDQPRDPARTVTWIACALIGAFLLQFAGTTLPFERTSDFIASLAVSRDNLAAGRVWIFATHWLLHSTSNILHVTVVLAGLMLLGRELEEQYGPRPLTVVFGLSLVLGALAWLALNRREDSRLIGATAGIYGLLAFVALAQPRREVRFLLFFFFPIRFRPRQILMVLALFEFLAMVLVDFANQQWPFSYAASAHLGGLVTGWASFHYVRHSRERTSGGLTETDSVAPILEPGADKVSKSQRAVAAIPASKPIIREQIDRILDKINSQGMGALTPEERRTLDNARDLLNRR